MVKFLPFGRENRCSVSERNPDCNAIIVSEVVLSGLADCVMPPNSQAFIYVYVERLGGSSQTTETHDCTVTLVATLSDIDEPPIQFFDEDHKEWVSDVELAEQPMDVTGDGTELLIQVQVRRNPAYTRKSSHCSITVGFKHEKMPSMPGLDRGHEHAIDTLSVQLG